MLGIFSASTSHVKKIKMLRQFTQKGYEPPTFAISGIPSLRQAYIVLAFRHSTLRQVANEFSISAKSGDC